MLLKICIKLVLYLSRPHKFFIACPQNRGSRDLICTEKEVCDGLKGKRCASAAVVDVWHIAGFTNNMISATAIRDKIEKIQQKYCKVQRLNKLNFKNMKSHLML